MRALILCLAAVLLIAGCAAPVKLQTQVFNKPDSVNSLSVGEFVSKNPVDGELLANLLRIELSNRGFDVTYNSPYVLFGSVSSEVYKNCPERAVISLKDKKGNVLFAFLYSCDFVFVGWQRCMSNEKFAAYLSNKITEKLRE